MIALWCSLAHAAITLEAPPMQGSPVVVAITDEEGRPRGGETVRAVIRPGLSGEHEVALGITDALGRVRWEPEEPGVARLRAGDDDLPIRVAWAAPPAEVVVELGLLYVGAAAAAGWGLLGHRARRRRS